MLESVHPKLPMRDKEITKDFYVNQMGFNLWGNPDFPEYLMIEKDRVQLHFFLYKDLDPFKNYGQVYIRISHIKKYYQQLLDQKIRVLPEGRLQLKPWGQWEFSILDPDKNLLTFGESVNLNLKSPI